jgi:hypothetical protein
VLFEHYNSVQSLKSKSVNPARSSPATIQRIARKKKGKERNGIGMPPGGDERFPPSFLSVELMTNK